MMSQIEEQRSRCQSACTRSCRSSPPTRRQEVLRERGESDALQAASPAPGQVEISTSLALEAGRFDLPLADSLIYATMPRHGAKLWTQDEDFEGCRTLAAF